MIKYILISLFFVACNNFQKNDAIKNVESITHRTISNDTLISYTIEGISSEGAESIVRYVNNKIFESTTTLYIGTGQISVKYYFEKNKVKVNEMHYYYKTEIENVQSKEDMQLNKELNYYLDLKGSVIGDEVYDKTDIFQEFKKEIPFEIGNG